jgi:hypothetical protein
MNMSIKSRNVFKKNEFFKYYSEFSLNKSKTIKQVQIQFSLMKSPQKKCNQNTIKKNWRFYVSI